MKAIHKNIYIFLAIVSSVLYTYKSTAQLRQASPPVHIVAVMSEDYPQYREAYEGFNEALRQSDIRYTIELIESIEENSINPGIVNQISEKNTDLILAIGTRAATRISAVIRDIPIVYSMVVSPNFNANSGMRNDNITGVTLMVPVIEQFRLLRRIIPDLKNIGVIYTSGENAVLIREAERAALNLNLNLVKGEVNSEREVPQTLQNLIRIVDVIWKIVDTSTNSRESTEYIILEGYRDNIPVIGLAENIVRAGAVLALCADYIEVGRQSGIIAQSILAGADPADMTVENPKNFVLYVNGRIADGIGLEIPESINRRMKVIIK